MVHPNCDKNRYIKRHSLGLVATSILILWIALYSFSDQQKHLGSFFGNAIADWSGIVVTVLATKHLYEKGSAESRDPKPKSLPPKLRWFREHSLTIFLVVTGTVWTALYIHMDSESKWGQVVGNVVSEWVQIIATVLLTKHLIEAHSKESRDGDEGDE